MSNPGRSYPFVKTTHLLYYSSSKVLSFRRDWMSKCLYTPRMYVHSRWSLWVICKITCKTHFEVLNSCLNTYYILLFTEISLKNIFWHFYQSLEIRFRNFSGYALFRCDWLSDLLCSNHKDKCAQWLSVFQCYYRHTPHIHKKQKMQPKMFSAP